MTLESRVRCGLVKHHIHVIHDSPGDQVAAMKSAGLCESLYDTHSVVGTTPYRRRPVDVVELVVSAPHRDSVGARRTQATLADKVVFPNTVSEFTVPTSLTAPPRVTSPLVVMPFEKVPSPVMAIASADSSSKFTLTLRILDPPTVREFEVPKTLATPLILKH